jgi:uncharacterized membrane protein (UPF0127 family)
VLELPVGSIAESQTKIGDSVLFEPVTQPASRGE